MALPCELGLAQCGYFALLPPEVVLAIVAQLSTDISSLQSLSGACRAFASLFRDEHLWRQLITRRWGLVDSICPESDQTSLQDLHESFAMRKFVKPSEHSHICMEPLADFFGQLSPGIYQLRLHKQRHKCFHERSFQIVLFGRVNSKRETTYYELMHDNELTITTEPFQVDMQNPWVHLMNPPSGLQSLQLHKLQQWDLIKVSPVFVTSNTPLQFMDASSAGFDEDGNSIYISVRFGNHAELGRSSSGYRFLYGRYGSYREESAPHKQFQGKAAWPGLLVNLSCYKWIPTDLQRVQSLKKRVVYLGQAEEGTLHAVRVLFRGWRHATLPNGEQSAVMQSEGRVISLLPGKFVFGKDRPDYAMFTWKGRATGGPAVRLADNQEFQMLCYRVFLE